MEESHFSAFEDYAREKGLKSTKQRTEIVKIFLKCKDHLSVEDLHRMARKKNPKVGYATVYRTLKLLVESGLAAERRFDEGHTRYEHVSPEEHHDHLICLGCGKIIEFEDERIENLQVEIAGGFNFIVHNHRLELYGYCEDCSRENDSA